jgi:Domain of unknown function (DUF4412)
MRQLVALFTSLVVVAAAASAADKGLMVRERTNSNGKVMEVTTYYTADKTVIDAPRQRTIVDLSAKTMTMIDKAARSYTVTTFDAMRRQGDVMRQQLAAQPEDQRKKVLGPAVEAAEVKTQATGKSDTILGHPAKEYEVQAGPVSGLVWMAAGVAVPAAKQAWDKQQAAMRPFSRAMDRYTDAVAALGGFPVRTATTMKVEGTPDRVSEKEVLEIKEAAPPPDMLAVPEGFNKVTLPGLG